MSYIYNTIDTTDNLLKNSSNKIASQVPITIKDESNNISRLPLIDIKNSSQILTNTTNQNSDVIESQMKKLFDLHKQMYDHTIAIFQKQEKTMNQMQSQIKQIKSTVEKLKCVIEGKKKTEWWEQYVEDGVKEIINECLYPKEESLSLHIKKHLKIMAPEKMERNEQTTKWNILWQRIEEKVGSYCCSYRGSLFGTIRKHTFIFSIYFSFFY
ncbi:unnamed protein product [Rhizophagus irregularis]|nr:unnamed protein product [Rhizophagus irregularis]